MKWAGGKSRLLDRLLAKVPARPFATYAEPFCGGGAMFFALAEREERPFRRALLSDRNEELVALYTAIKGDVERLIEHVRAYQQRHVKKAPAEKAEHFYEVRKLDTAGMTSAERGARLLFLNKTCFNGLWRVNAAGQFNVPFGKYENPRILDEEGLRSAHRALAAATIRCGDYTSVTRELREGDFAYFDPPYMPVSKTANFTAYAASGFGWNEQVALAAELARLRELGVWAMLSNAETPELVELYASHGFTIDRIQAARAINSDPTKRGDVTELVVTTYPNPTSIRAARSAKAVKSAAKAVKSARPAEAKAARATKAAAGSAAKRSARRGGSRVTSS